MALEAFSKPPIPISEQIAFLKSRGMIIEDLDKAEHYLRFIGYHRLSGYWYEFKLHHDDPSSPTQFTAETTFQNILDRYVFDRALRSLTIDALERIEVAVKSVMMEEMCVLEGAHWLSKAECFQAGKYHSKLTKNTLQATGISPEDKTRRTDAVDSYKQKYHSPIEPASWIVFESLSFGTISQIYAHLLRKHQNPISKQLGLARDKLASWLHAYCYIRNICAHHGRLWNRTLRISPSISKAERAHILNPQKFYNHAVAIQFMLNKISGNHSWALQLDELLSQNSGAPLNSMGFPDNWTEQKIWN